MARKAEQLEDAPLILPPEAREGFLGAETVDPFWRALIDGDRLEGGWLLTGAHGIGKATLSFRIARALLSPKNMLPSNSLHVEKGAGLFTQIANLAHPDLVVIRKPWDEKAKKYKNAITVDEIRHAINSTRQTSSTGHRVVIIDRADDMNQNAANALLKVLEEPPKGTVLLLLSAAPGRLLPTIRSRCRKFSVPPSSQDSIVTFLKEETELSDEEILRLALNASGRPGYALGLANEAGAAAAALTEQFFKTLTQGGNIMLIADQFSGKAKDEILRTFCQFVLSGLSNAARENASHAQSSLEPLSRYHPSQLLEAWSQTKELSDKGLALNMDKKHLVLTIGQAIQQELRGK